MDTGGSGNQSGSDSTSHDSRGNGSSTEQAPETTTTAEWQLVDFLTRFAVDREKGAVLPLVEYLELFPGHEELIAREYLAQKHGLSVPEHAVDDARDEAGTGTRRIGPYQILRELGHGGQGVVYLARDPRLGRRVALKVLRSPTSGRTTRQRFQREATLASKLDHPGICSIFATGEDEGLRYIAMRFVPGTPLNRKLEEAREQLPQASPGRGDRAGRGSQASRFLTVGEAGVETASQSSRRGIGQVLHFFEKVARAMHVAHSRGVLHRDLKPGNLMITPEGEPVVLDFGLGRDLENEELQLTVSGDVFGTPAYMAPEQLEPDLDTRTLGPATDIWALAVVLYESLTLERPFRAATRAALFRAIRERAPRRPSACNPALPRDLDVVLEVALSKEPRQRYASMLDLAEDLRRVRELQPILARKPSAALRLWRWSQRNPGLAASLGALFLFLVAALSYTHVQRQEEARLRQVSERRSTELQQLTNAILVDLHDAIVDVPGTTEARQAILDKALGFLKLLEPLADDPGQARPEVRRDLVLAHLRVGDVYGNLTGANLGQPRKAEAHYRQALDLASDLPPPAAYERALCHARLGNVQEQLELLDTAVASYRKGLGLLAGESGDAVRVRELRATLHLHLGRVLYRWREARDRAGAARNEFARGLAALRPGEGPRSRILRAQLLVELARVDLAAGDLAATTGHCENAWALLEDLGEGEQRRLSVNLARGACAGLRADVARRQGQLQRAQDLLARSREAFGFLTRMDPANEIACRALIGAHRDAAVLHQIREQFAEAEAALQQAMELADRGAGRFGQEWAAPLKADCYQSLGSIHYERLRPRQAAAHFARAHTLWADILARDPDDVAHQEQVALCEQYLGRSYVRMGDHRRSRKWLRAAWQRYRDLVTRHPDKLMYARAQKVICQQLGELAFQRTDFRQAARWYRQALDIHATSSGGPGRSQTAVALKSEGILRQGLANVLYQQRRFQEAVREINRAVALLRQHRSRSPEDVHAGRLLVLGLVDQARFHRSGEDQDRTRQIIGEAAELAASILETPSPSPKLRHVYIRCKLVESLVLADHGATAAARQALRDAERQLERVPGGPASMTYMYQVVHRTLRRKLVDGGR